MKFYSATPKPETHRRIFGDLKSRLSRDKFAAVESGLQSGGLANWHKATEYAAYVGHVCDALEEALLEGRDYAEIEIRATSTASGHPEFLRLDADECEITETAEA